MRGLPLTVVNHGPALPRLDDEGLGVAVAGLGHAVHGIEGRSALGPPRWAISRKRVRQRRASVLRRRE